MLCDKNEFQPLFIKLLYSEKTQVKKGLLSKNGRGM